MTINDILAALSAGTITREEASLQLQQHGMDAMEAGETIEIHLGESKGDREETE